MEDYYLKNGRKQPTNSTISFVPGFFPRCPSIMAGISSEPFMNVCLVRMALPHKFQVSRTLKIRLNQQSGKMHLTSIFSFSVIFSCIFIAIVIICKMLPISTKLNFFISHKVDHFSGDPSRHNATNIYLGTNIQAEILEK